MHGAYGDPSNGDGYRLVFPALNAGPKNLKWAFEGIANGTVNVSNQTKRKGIADQKSGFREIYHNGDKVFRPGDYVYFRNPRLTADGRSLYSGTKLKPETVPLRLERAEFVRPIHDVSAYMKSTLSSIPTADVERFLLDDNEVKDFGDRLRGLFPDDLADAKVPVVTFEKALKDDVHEMITMMEKGVLCPSENKDGMHDPYHDAYRIAGKFFYWVMYDLTQKTEGPAEAFFIAQNQSREFDMAILMDQMNDRRKRVGGMCMSVVIPRKKIPMHMFRLP